VLRCRCFVLATGVPTRQDLGSRQSSPVSVRMGPPSLAPACNASLESNCLSNGRSRTYTCAATDCHLLCVVCVCLDIQVYVFVPSVHGVRDAATVERAHREGIREVERAPVRRQPEASDCARTSDCTLILNRLERDWLLKRRNERSRVCYRWGESSATHEKVAEFSEVSIRCFRARLA
jgi:hypothetical protein